MSETSTLIGYSGRTVGREELTLVPTPPATETHRPIAHHEIVGALIETLGFRHIGVVHDEYAVSPDGMKMFGVLDLATEMEGCRFSIGLRNSHDKSMRLAMTCGYRVFVCSNMAFSGDFTPVLAKHSKSFSLIDCISVGVDRMQRNFEPMRKQVETWQKSELADVTAKVVIYEALRGGQTRSSKTSCANRARPLLRTQVRGVPIADDLEPLERVYVRVQRTGTDSAIQGDSETRRIPRSAVLRVVLDHGAVSADRSLLDPLTSKSGSFVRLRMANLGATALSSIFRRTIDSWRGSSRFLYESPQSVSNLISHFTEDSQLLIRRGSGRVFKALMESRPATGKYRAGFFCVVADSEYKVELLAGEFIDRLRATSCDVDSDLRHRRNSIRIETGGPRTRAEYLKLVASNMPQQALSHLAAS